MNDHLGNVSVVVSDYRSSNVRSASNYYPFGMMARSYNASEMRYGFNGQEKVGEWNDNYTFAHRIHDSRLGRFLSVDPIANSFPWNSPYSFAENRVIDSKEMEGLERYHYTYDIIDGNYALRKIHTEHMNEEGPVGAIAYHLFGVDYKEAYMLHYEDKLYAFNSPKEMQSFDPENPGEQIELNALYETIEKLEKVQQILEAISDARSMRRGRTQPSPQIRRVSQKQVEKKSNSTSRVVTGQKLSKVVKTSSSIGGKTVTQTNTTKGWTTGDPINNQTFKGTAPKWDTVRARYWKNKAFYAKEGDYSEENTLRMKKGLAPQRVNPKTGKTESMELHHTPAQRDGGMYDVQEVWPEDHAKIDPHRKTGNK